MECLAAWLRRADKVDSKGGANWVTLRDALKKLKENAIAEGIERDKITFECSLLTSHHTALFKNIDYPIDIARTLYREGVLSLESLNACAIESTSHTVARTGILLSLVYSAVSENHKYLEIFVGVLRNYSSTVSVADEIWSEYVKNYTGERYSVLDIGESVSIDATLKNETLGRRGSSPKDGIFGSSPKDEIFGLSLKDEISGSSLTQDILGRKGSSPKHATDGLRRDGGDSLVLVPQYWERKFSDQQKEFQTLFFDIRRAIKQGAKSARSVTRSMKDYLSDVCPELSPRLDRAKNVKDIMNVIKEKCTLIDICILEKLLQVLDIREAEGHIKKYKESVSEFCEKVHARFCSNDTFQVVCGPTPFRHETVTFVLDWKADECTIADVKQIIGEGLGEDSNVKIIVISETNSIQVVCTFPVSLTGVLIARATEKLELLKKKGLLQLTIGYHTVYGYHYHEENALELTEEKTIMITPLKDTKEESTLVRDSVYTTDMQEELEDKVAQTIGLHEVQGLLSLSHPNVNTESIAQGQIQKDKNFFGTEGIKQFEERKKEIEKVLKRKDKDQGQRDSGYDSVRSSTISYSRSLGTLPLLNYAKDTVTCMIIGSYGTPEDKSQQNTVVLPKIIPNGTITTGQQIRKEFEKIEKMYRKNSNRYHIQYVYCDMPGMEYEREYYKRKIKKLFNRCTHSRAIIHYTGHGEKDTGNWCFKDGVITFQDIFGLYEKHFKMKPLTIVTDCSCSGQWIKECVKVLDEMNIPSCGHHTRKQGILLNIFASCRPDEEATVLSYINEAVYYSDEDKEIQMHTSKHLSSGQTTMGTDFKEIRCIKPASVSCELDVHWKWNDHLCNKYERVKVIRNHKEPLTWSYVLIDEDKFDDFIVKQEMGSVIIPNDYGTVLYTGCGDYPPMDIVHKVELLFKCII